MGDTFSRFSLRTTDAPGATAFYDAVIGRHGDAVFPLHEQALARGARPHWLGHLDVADPEAAAARLLERGGERYGQRPDGVVVLRDPGGAILALGGVTGPSTAGVAWHVLRSRDAARAASTYAELFGWSLLEEIDLGPLGRYRPFAWRAGDPPAGAIGGIEGFPGVHTQWIFFFRVPSVERAVAEVRARGGMVASANELPDGRHAAVCDDPQGAAFGLIDG
jgi:predicted enzyme related to lactoylglutathione lyase